jgi:hypothetical protein
MKKKVIRAKLVLEDIRSGMNDWELMAKYKLSSKGLQSLFKKLGDAGLLKHLNASEVIKDMRSGISDRDLMEKHRLSDKGLAALFVEMDRAGLIRRPLEEDTLRTKLAIHEPEILNDIRSGTGRSELMGKYHLTPRALRWISMKLVSSGGLGWQDVSGSICSELDELAQEKLRASKRHKLDFEAPIYEMKNPRLIGAIRDVSQLGIGVKGIEAEAGEAKTLVILGDDFGEYGTFALDATCKWVSQDPAGKYLAGFEISNISVGSMRELQLLIEMVRLRQGVKGRSTGD